MKEFISTLVLASSNQGKLAELQTLFAPFDINVCLQNDLGVEEIEETGLTFIENAILKARHASQITSLPAIADDSGLCVDALNGAPGLYSARYALLHGHSEKKDELNNHVLLDQLLNCDNRDAFFVCCLALCLSYNHPLPYVSIGRWEGHIARELSGDQGFGYDPLFIPKGTNLSAASLSMAEKQKISHRGKALKGLIKQLQSR